MTIIICRHLYISNNLNSYLYPTDEPSPGPHAKPHGALRPLLLHGPSLQIQDPPVVLIVAGGKLLSDLLLILWVDVVVQRLVEPVPLSVVEDRGEGVGHVDDPAGVARHHEQEPVGGLEYEVLQLVVCQERWFVGPVIRRGVRDSSERFDMCHRHPEDGQLVRLPGQGVTGGHHVGQLRDVR